MQKELKIVLISSVLINLAAGLFGPIYALFVEGIGGDLVTAGTAYSIFAIVTGGLIFYISKWEDHVKHKEKLIVAGRFLSIIGFGGYFLINSPVGLYVVQGILGIATAISEPAITSFYSQHLKKGHYASEWGAWGSAVWIVVGISALIGGYLANLYGFKVLFLIMLIFTIFSFLASLFLLRKK